MKVNNPWIALQCDAHQVPANGLATFLQEQYGQLGEDLILEGVMKSVFAALGLMPEQIRYVEIGANHPIQTSNSYLFARKWGGKGVLVEANPALISRLEAVRPNDKVLNVAVVPQDGVKTVRLNIAQNTELSSVDLGHLNSFGSLAQLDRVVEVPAVTLDEVLDQHCDEGLHLMSIDIEGVDLEVLAHARFTRRPLLVVTEPSRHYHRDAELGFHRVMHAKGYFELARTDYNLIFADVRAFSSIFGLTKATAAAPEGLRSFDIFDTLIARRCIQPEAVFFEVERRSGVPGLARLRHAAERAVEQGEYTLADIYREVARLGGLEAATADALMAHEIAVEVENVVPIADNIALVRDDSLLITDMYLPEHAIRTMLAKAGLPKHLCLLRSAHGKRHGHVWKALADAGVRSHHLGDNPLADHTQPLAVGMQATVTTVAIPTATERALAEAGAVRLAQTLRAARLATPTGTLSPELHRLQVELNLPVLLVSALHLLGASSTAGISQVLFSSRDSRFLQSVYEAAAAALPGVHAPSGYWYSSRIARAEGTPAYLDYCRSLFRTGSLLVDLCGTGASVAALRTRLGLGPTQLPLFVCERIDSPALESGLAQRYGLGQIDKPHALWTNASLVPNEVLELLNYVPEGMVRGVRAVPGGFIPLRDTVEFTGDVLAQVREQARFLGDWCAALQRELVPGVLAELMAELPAVCAAMSRAVPGLVPDVNTLMAAWLPAHRAHEQRLAQAAAPAAAAPAPAEAHA